tara:strand:- start:1469 stop:2731 length:1263 start_codon:yes stop_codon:yes gene_type:complete
LEAFVILCGGSNDPASSNDGLDGINNSNASKKSSSTALDKYTMQEKIVPLIKGIKTKEPAVGIAALNVLRQVGGVADADFVAMDILPVLWSMSLGPLLDLKQFQLFMDLIKSLSARVEVEQTKKLQELSGANGTQAKANDDFMSFGATNAFSSNGASDDPEIDFERLVKGNAGPTSPSNPLDGGWDSAPAQVQSPRNVSNTSTTPSFAWSTPSSATTAMSSNSMTVPMRPQQPTSRTITPDLSRFDALSPTTTQYSQPLQPQNAFSTPMQPQQNTYSTPLQPQTPSYQAPQPQTSVNWGAAAAAPNPWASNANSSNSLNSMSMNQQRPATTTPMNAFSLPPPGQQQRPQMGGGSNSFSLPPPPGANSYQASSNAGMGAFKPPQQSGAFGAPQQQQMGFGQAHIGQQGQKKSGLDAWESLL